MSLVDVQKSAENSSRQCQQLVNSKQQERSSESAVGEGGSGSRFADSWSRRGAKLTKRSLLGQWKEEDGWEPTDPGPPGNTAVTSTW